MLEKLGLPDKPSMRGAAWVIDASHCQGCSSQFTFINRKHHCRRCGGLFCNSCTHQRMILRGQGDSPVRICDPCKKLEDAARFELRYGHKNRAAKGNPKQASKHEEEILGQILGTDGKQSLLSGHEAHADVFSGLQKAASSSSSSNLKEECMEVDTLRSMSVGTHTGVPNVIQSCSPEELRKQAVEEKNQYKILKGEGKSEEALQAFKRSKELERQAGALEISLRKSRRMASKVPNLSIVGGTEKTDIHEEPSSKKLPSRRGEKGEDDLANELRGLGWSDTDLHEVDKKPANLTLEGELSNLLGEMPKKSSLGKGNGGIDNSQVIAHKKKALMFKREGKLAEAKEELKKAKILEKQLEEQELLGEDDDPDDELSALIHSLDDDKQDEFLLDRAPDRGINFDNLFVGTDDLAVDGNFEVTDNDMNDPELAAALKSFGWAEEDDEHVADHVLRPARLDLEALQHEVLTLKRESLNQKRAGNTTEAMALLKKAKLLEKDLEGMQSGAQDFTPEFMPKTSIPSSADEENAREIKSSNANLPPKSKLAIQKELLSLKKKALTLRREGRVPEAEEELKKGRVLEQQLEEMENAPKQPLNKGGRNLESTHVHEGDRGILDLGDDGVEAEADVTEQDLHDPALLSVLKNMGWNDDDNVESNMKNKTSKQVSQQSSHDTVLSLRPRKAMRSKAEIQKELLGVKRKALALRRQGKTEEAEEELERAKALENEMVEMEVSYNVISKEMESHGFESSIAKENPDSQKAAADDAQSTDSGLSSVIMSIISMDEEVPAPGVPNMNSKRSYTTETPRANSSIPITETLGFESLASLNWGVHSEERSTDVVSILPQSGQSSTMVSLLSGSKRKITYPSTEDSTRKEGSDNHTFPPSNAPIQLEIQGGAKESTSGEHEILSHGTSSLPLVDISESATQELSSTHGLHAQKAEILARKRKAVALKREGKLVEAREELRQAKLLEKCLEDAEKAGVSSKSDSASTSESTPFMQESITIQAQKPLSGRDRFKLQQESLSHKRNALKLRREGKVAESEAEFELAKALESQLEELGTQDSSANSAMGKTGAIDDVIVEDVLDPQLMSALKSIGWGDTDISIQPSRKSEPKPNNDKGGSPNAERAQLEEQVKAEKLRALNLKRAGKQAEALEALRSAKKLEKRVGLLAS